MSDLSDDTLYPREILEDAHAGEISWESAYFNFTIFDVLFLLKADTLTDKGNQPQKARRIEDVVFRLEDGAVPIFTDKEAVEEGGHNLEQMTLMTVIGMQAMGYFSDSDVVINPHSNISKRIDAETVRQLAEGEMFDEETTADILGDLMTSILDEEELEEEEATAFLSKLNAFVNSGGETDMGELIKFEVPKKKPKELLDIVKEYLTGLKGVKSAYYARVKMPALIAPSPMEFFAIEFDAPDPDAFYDTLADIVSPHLGMDRGFDMSLITPETEAEYRSMIKKEAFKFM